MGLQERQAWAKINETVLPETTKALDSLVGTTVALSINEQSFATKELIESIPTMVFSHLIYGFKEICTDKLAKEAVQSTVKKIVIANIADDKFEMIISGDTLNVKANFNAEGTCGLQYPHGNDYHSFLNSNL